MNPIQRIREIREDVEALNEEVRELQDIITLKDALTIIDLCRETEDWLKGVRKLLGS